MLMSLKKTTFYFCHKAFCPDGWVTSISSTCIKLYSELRTWITARATCEGLGGDLVRILNENLSGFIYGENTYKIISYCILMLPSEKCTFNFNKT